MYNILSMKKYLFKWQHKGKSESFIYEWYKGIPSALWIANNMGDVEVYENVVYELLK